MRTPEPPCKPAAGTARPPPRSPSSCRCHPAGAAAQLEPGVYTIQLQPGTRPTCPDSQNGEAGGGQQGNRQRGRRPGIAAAVPAPVGRCLPLPLLLPPMLPPRAPQSTPHRTRAGFLTVQRGWRGQEQLGLTPTPSDWFAYWVVRKPGAQYDFNVMNTPINIQVSEEGGVCWGLHLRRRPFAAANQAPSPPQQPGTPACPAAQHSSLPPPELRRTTARPRRAARRGWRRPPRRAVQPRPAWLRSRRWPASHGTSRPSPLCPPPTPFTS